MVKSEPTRIIETGLFEHPANQAWRELRSVRVEPLWIEILKGKPSSQTKASKRLVCRLAGVGPKGTNIIGKRARRSEAVVENAIYEEILPYLPIPSLHYYGMVEEEDGEFCWLFLEDAGEEAYSMQLAEHRTLITEWLGRLHTSAADVAVPPCLPDKGPHHYLKRLQSARDTLVADLANLTLPPDDIAPLKSILDQYEVLESRWDRVETFCGGMPQTLVHGDIIPKNLRIRSNQAGKVLLPFDWGEAGWGVPATDIRDLDAFSYWSVVNDCWPWLDVRAVQRLAIAGMIFRCLDAIYWELSRFDYEWLKQPWNSMRIYESWLADAIRAAGMED